jgi:transcriptional regulator with GAF, ATPase, and Fis domain
MPETPSSPPPRAAEVLKRAALEMAALRAAATGQAPAVASATSGPHAPPPAAAAGGVEDLLQDVMRAARDVTSILELQELLATVLDAFVSITGAERGFLMLYDQDGVLQPRAAHNLDASQLDAVQLSQRAVRRAAESGESDFVDDVVASGQYTSRDSIVVLGVRSYNCVPLVAGGRILGVCYTDSKQRGRCLNDRERTVLEAFAGQAALAIENARRHGELLDVKSRLEAENENLRRQIDRRQRAGSLIGESAVMERLHHVIDKVASSGIPVLLLGETGTGKELIARAIHNRGPRRDAPFVTVNAGAVPEFLLESELFGHRRGAFTGAVEDHRGLFLEADGGTLFLDEIGEMPLPMQVKLLRALQEGEVKRVGDAATQRVDVRFVAATNRDLTAEVAAGRFRADLFYRLNVFPIHVPPLRERGNDVLLIAEEFVRRFAKRYGKRGVSLAPDAARWILEQSWPGNVRELQNCIERAVTLCEPGARITADLMRPVFEGMPAAAPGATPQPGPAVPATLRVALDRAERDTIRAALEVAEGRVGAAAQLLGISRQHLHTLQRKHGLGSQRPTDLHAGGPSVNSE